MTNKIINKKEFIRNKLRLYNYPIIEKWLLLKILKKFDINYTLTQLVNFKFIKPIKKQWNYYINNFSSKLLNPFVVWSLYFDDSKYVFWGLAMYNRYGLTEQIPSSAIIYNTKYSGIKKIWGINFILKRKWEKYFKKWIVEEEFEWFRYKVISKDKAKEEIIKQGF